MKQIVDSFYNAIKSGDNEMLWSLIHDDFTLLCPTRNHILSGMYQGKSRFFEEVLPQVFGCVDPEQIVFCNDYRILCEGEATVVALAVNKGRARSGESYDQAYLHVFKCIEGQVLTLIEGFDTALANRALWGGSEALPADEDFSIACLDALGFA
jgi:ketosteroid isomerase-like protein